MGHHHRAVGAVSEDKGDVAVAARVADPRKQGWDLK